MGVEPSGAVLSRATSASASARARALACERAEPDALARAAAGRAETRGGGRGDAFAAEELGRRKKRRAEVRLDGDAGIPLEGARVCWLVPPPTTTATVAVPRAEDDVKGTDTDTDTEGVAALAPPVLSAAACLLKQSSCSCGGSCAVVAAVVDVAVLSSPPPSLSFSLLALPGTASLDWDSLAVVGWWSRNCVAVWLWECWGEVREGSSEGPPSPSVPASAPAAVAPEAIWGLTVCEQGWWWWWW